MGVSTGQNDSFQTMSNNIKKINSTIVNNHDWTTVSGSTLGKQQFVLPVTNLKLTNILWAWCSWHNGNGSDEMVWLDIENGIWRKGYKNSQELASYSEDGIVHYDVVHGKVMYYYFCKLVYRK